MKKFLLLLSLLVTGSATLLSCGDSGTEEENKTESEQIIYQCPMKCEGDKTYMEPGQCPVCGMDLEKVEHHGDHDHDHEHDH